MISIMAKNINNITIRARTDYRGFSNESLESMIRRFKKKLEKENVMYDMRKHDYYTKPSVKKKLKSKLARQRMQREMLKKQKYLDKKNDK